MPNRRNTNISSYLLETLENHIYNDLTTALPMRNHECETQTTRWKTDYLNSNYSAGYVNNFYFHILETIGFQTVKAIHRHSLNTNKKYKYYNDDNTSIRSTGDQLHILLQDLCEWSKDHLNRCQISQ